MNKALLGLCLVTMSGSVLSLHSSRERHEEPSARSDVTAIDPRLIGLPAGPGTVPAGSALETLARNDPVFAAGLELFDRAFHAAEGVGAPGMNADSCRGCHQDPFLGGAGGLELNVSRFGDDGYGSYRFQNLPGGQGLSKLFPPTTPGREEYDPLTASVFEQRQTPSILGAGLIDSISGAVILANEDPGDSNHDGVFGVARMVDAGRGLEVGRFGWKAQAPRLRDFVMDAMGGELGITTPDDGRGFAMLADGDGVMDPELSPEEVDQLDHFLSNLPAPPRGDSHDPLIPEGRELFTTSGCAVCHVPALEGRDGPVPLYSNLLLHNVMPAGFRGMAEPGAGMGFFRTPPLWGIGATAPYMHDGRASTLRQAILAHDGEAAGAVAEVQALTPLGQRALISFLRSL
jgi:hypothetical protein